MGATPWSRAFGGEQTPAAPQRPWPATLTVGTDGRITSWSRGAQALFGLSAGRACGRRMRTLMVRPEDRASLDELLGTVLAGRSWSGSLPLLDADGLVHPVECGWQPIQDRRGRPGALIVVTDRVGQSVPAARPAPLGTAEAALAAIGQFQEHAASVAMMRRVQLLTEANTMIGTTLDMAQTARELLNVAVPRFADTASVVLMESVVDEFELPPPWIEGDEIRVRRVAVKAQDPALEAMLPENETVLHGPNTVFGQVLRTGRPRTLSSLDLASAQKLWPGMDPSPAPHLVGNCMLVVPLVARGAVLGIAMFARGSDRRPFSGGEAVLGEEFAARAALCVDNARLYSHERNTALMLQRSLLPTDSGDHTGVDVAHRYLPASDLTGVGGDWYDVIGLRGGRVAMVVGDVMGHGVRAAAVMGQLRTAVRAYARLDLPPHEVLQLLDGLASEIDATLIATCVYAVYDPSEQRLVYASAGHLPLMIREADGSVTRPEEPCGPPLGTGGYLHTSASVALGTGATGVLYTDGLVERREQDIDEGLDALARTFAGATGQPDVICARLLRAMGVTPDHDDDVAALVFQLPERDTETAELFRSASLDLLGGAEAVSSARAFTSGVLASWRLGEELLDLGVLAVSELVSNSFTHGHPPMRLRLRRTDRRLTVEVTDADDHLPRRRRAEPADETGRGIAIIATIASSWGTRRTPDGGKAVWCDFLLPTTRQTPRQ